MNALDQIALDQIAPLSTERLDEIKAAHQRSLYEPMQVGENAFAAWVAVPDLADEIERRLTVAEVEQFLMGERDEHAADSIWWQAVDMALAAFRARYATDSPGGEAS